MDAALERQIEKLIQEVYTWLDDNGFTELTKNFDGENSFIKIPIDLSKKKTGHSAQITIKAVSLSRLELSAPLVPIPNISPDELNKLYENMFRRKAEQAHFNMDEDIEGKKWFMVHEWFDITQERVGDATRLFRTIALVRRPFVFQRRSKTFIDGKVINFDIPAKSVVGSK